MSSEYSELVNTHLNTRTHRCIYDFILFIIISMSDPGFLGVISELRLISEPLDLSIKGR